MKTIILCNRSRGLVRSLNNIPGPLRYISFVDTQESREICTLLRDMPSAEELPRAKLFRERNWEFRKKYIEFIGRLNIQNHSQEWWAMPFTNKNPAATALCRNTFYFLLTAELASADATNLVVISDSVDLAAQLKTWAQRAGFRVEDLIRKPGTLRRIIKRYTPAGIAQSVVRTFFIWIRTRRYRPAHNSREAHLVIASIAHPRSFSTRGVYKDAYFGPLVDHLASSKQNALVLAMLLEQPFEQIKQLRSLNKGIPVVPLEACFTLRDFLACTLRSLRFFMRPVDPQGPMEIDGMDLSCLVKRTIRDTAHSGDIFMSLRVYYCGRWLARKLHVTRCLYPYENRAWEKMLLQGMRCSSPQTQLMGYQHASITLSHTNFIMAEGESQIIPLPNTILTTGKNAKQWLEQEGNYPLGIFKNACALRQRQPDQGAGKTRIDTLTRVFVALGLGTGTEEYPRILAFLEKAFAEESGYDIRIRPHPGASLESVLDMAPFERRDFFTASKGSLAEDLQWAEVALYASSTVGLEAMSAGIPVIYLDLGDFLDTNHMTGSNELRWSVEDPSQLVDTIRQIDRLPEDEFLARQMSGQEYATAYLEPVTAGGIQRFLE